MRNLSGERSPVAATPLIAIATFAAFWATGNIIELGSWLLRPAFALAIVAAAIVVVRLFSRSRALPTLTGAAATFLVLVPLFAKNPAGGTYFFPTPASLSALFRSFGDGATYAQESAHPAPVDSDLAALLTLAVLMLFVAAEHVAVSWRAVGTAGLMLLVPWVPTIVLREHVSAGVLIVALAAWVLALAVSRSDAVARRRVSWTTSLLGTTAALVLMALVIPSAIGGAGWGAIDQRYQPDLFDGRNTQLNLEVDLHKSLTVNSEVPVFAYVASAGKSDAFRIYTFTSFDGTQWDYVDATVSSHPATDTLLWPLPVDDWSDTPHNELSIAILSLSASNLPVPVAPRTANVEGPWFYDPATDQIVGKDTTTHDLHYSLVVDFAYQNAEALRASDARLALGQADDLTDPRYVALPSSLDLPRILDLTRSVTAGATSRYDQALAIQEYLRDPANFVYDPSATSTSADAVSEFLDSRHGYCIQFATTMVMMLRSIGIPARLSEGFLPGTLEDGSTYVVRGADAHAWPEIYFPGHGWVRFEPTPAVQTGALPSWADPNAGQPEQPGSVFPNTGPDDVPITPPASDGGGGFPTWIITILAILGATGGLAFAYLWRRRGVAGRGSRALHGAEAAWQRLNRRLGSRGWPASATPREAVEHVLTEIRVARGRPARPEPESALLALSSAVSDLRYAPSARTIESAQLEEWLDEVTREAEPSEEPVTGHPARGDARSAPQDGS